MWADTLVGLGTFPPVGLLTVVTMVKDPNKVKLIMVIVFSCFVILDFFLYYKFVVLLYKETNKPEVC